MTNLARVLQIAAALALRSGRPMRDHIAEAKRIAASESEAAS